MELGIGLPVAGTFASTQAIAQIAKRADELDYAAVWTFERVLRPTADIPSWDGTVGQLPEIYKQVYDSLDALSYVAAITTKVKLGTSIIDALFQSPVQLGKRFATLDQLSSGRVIAGLGQGSLEAEFAATGTPLKRRGAGFEEYLHALQAVWGPDPVKFDGRFYKIEPSNINPKPVQKHVPVIIGAGSPAALERAARMTDGFNPVLFAWEPIEGAVKGFLAAAQAAGRDISKLQVVARLNTAPNANPHVPFGGSLDQIKDDIARAQAAGFTQIFWDMNWANVSIEEQLKLMEQVRPFFK